MVFRQDREDCQGGAGEEEVEVLSEEDFQEERGPGIEKVWEVNQGDQSVHTKYQTDQEEGEKGSGRKWARPLEKVENPVVQVPGA